MCPIQTFRELGYAPNTNVWRIELNIKETKTLVSLSLTSPHYVLQ